MPPILQGHEGSLGKTVLQGEEFVLRHCGGPGLQHGAGANGGQVQALGTNHRRLKKLGNQSEDGMSAGNQSEDGIGAGSKGRQVQALGTIFSQSEAGNIDFNQWGTCKGVA